MNPTTRMIPRIMTMTTMCRTQASSLDSNTETRIWDTCLAEEEKTKWEVGYRIPGGFGEVYVSRQIAKLKKLVEKPKKLRLMRKEKQENTDDEVLQDEFREFL